jgi:hypothetical protein
LPPYLSCAIIEYVESKVIRPLLRIAKDHKGLGKISTSKNYIPPLLKFQYEKEVRMNIYVGNLLREATEADLRQAFEAFGQVTSVKIITDRYTGDSRGFGFVEMPNDQEAKSAVSGLNGKDFKGRTLKVNEARPRDDR